MFLLGWSVVVPTSRAREKGAAFWNEKIGRGINLGNALEAPNEGAWLVRLKELYFKLIAEAGFNSVRIPVRWSAHAAQTAPYTIDPAFLERVDWAVKQAISNKLITIINIHHYKEFMEAPDRHADRFLGIWKQLAAHFRNYPPALYFEVMNEPHGKVTAEIWNDLQNKAIALIRKTNPNRAVLVAPVGYNRINQLRNLKLPSGDRNLIVSVHYYEPFQFTHQGAGWVKRKIPTGTKWLGTDEEKAAIRNDFEEARRWSKENNIPVNVGEFGAYYKADMASRVRWTAFVRGEAERCGMSWNYWEFCSSFGIYDPDTGKWRKELFEALIPNEK